MPAYICDDKKSQYKGQFCLCSYCINTEDCPKGDNISLLEASLNPSKFMNQSAFCHRKCSGNLENCKKSKFQEHFDQMKE